MIEITVTSTFEKSIKKLVKKFPSVKKVYQESLDELEKTQGIGDEISGHQNYYKVRYPNVDAKKGKSGGFRLIYYWDKEKQESLVLVDIYSKTEQENVDWDAVKRGMEDIENEWL